MSRSTTADVVVTRGVMPPAPVAGRASSEPAGWGGTHV
jgi:hypothetical protein